MRGAGIAAAPVGHARPPHRAHRTHARGQGLASAAPGQQLRHELRASIGQSATRHSIGARRAATSIAGGGRRAAGGGGGGGGARWLAARSRDRRPLARRAAPRERASRGVTAGAPTRARLAQRDMSLLDTLLEAARFIELQERRHQGE